jgi:flavorubredoxin
MARVDEIVDGIYRISAFVPEYGITFNQFLIEDDEPALVHTGIFQAFEEVHAAVGQVLDPARLRHVILGHFEADECGGMQRFVDQAPGCTLVGSNLSAGLNLSAWDYRGPYAGMSDGDRLELGRHTLRFLETPHVHHWDSMMIVEESTRSLFPADLFIQPGEQPPIVQDDLTGEMIALYRGAGIFAHEAPVRRVVERVALLDPEWIHPMHGGSVTRAISGRYYDALREREFAYDGMLLGRRLPAEAWDAPVYAEA